MASHRSDRIVGALALAFALVLLLLWIPADVESGVIETFRRRTTIGDAMLPTMLGYGIGAIGLWLLLRPRRAPSPDGPGADSNDTGFGLQNLRFLIWMAAVLVACLLAMRWTGPIVADLAGSAEGGYRSLRDTVPWKYLGYLVGGFLLLSALLIRLNGGMRIRWLMIALVCVVVLMLLIDVPFDDLLLPPNGDV
ncbi:MAG: hypothetical protein R3E83_12515 [Burkholderiaceae bacterium]